MIKMRLSLLALLFCVIAAAMAPSAQAASSAIGTMAEIAMHLNHYPGDDEKMKLDAIIADAHASAGEKALAGALKRMQHQVGGADVNKLRDLMQDGSTSEQEKLLAEVLLGINHKPTEADKERLKSLLPKRASSAGGY